MRLLADLHTHTIASGHAYSTLTELAQSAAVRGIELIAVCDHGPALPGAPHEWYFGNLKNAPSVLDGVRVLKGVEANIVSDTENGLDLQDELLARLDFVACGFHPETGVDGSDREANTRALLRAISNPHVDMITHPGNDAEFPIHRDRAIEAAVRHGVILELNDYSFSPLSGRSVCCDCERQFAEAARDAGATIAVSSDAHHASHVGRFDTALSVAEELEIPLGQIVNRNAAAVLEHLIGRRERPRLDSGGVWESPGTGLPGRSSTGRAG